MLARFLENHWLHPTQNGLLDKFSEWQLVYEEETFKSTQAFVSNTPVVEVIQIRLSCQNCMLSRLEQ